MPPTIDGRTVRKLSPAETQFWYASAFADAARLTTENDPPYETEDPIPDCHWRISSAGIKHLSDIIRELVDLKDGPENDEYGRLRPTRVAYSEATRILVDAAIVAARDGRQIPLGHVSTDSEGGVRVEWMREAKNVRLIIHADDIEASYIYHGIGSDYATEGATPELLARWLREID